MKGPKLRVLAPTPSIELGWEGGERGVQDGDTCAPVADPCECMSQSTTVL